MATLADQLGWCITSKDYLSDLSYSITSVENTVNATVEMLVQYSFEELNAPLFPLQEWLSKATTETQKFMCDNHIRYLEESIKSISNQLK